jgi:hypothetical protein
MYTNVSEKPAVSNSALKMEVASSSETFVPLYQSARRHNILSKHLHTPPTSEPKQTGYELPQNACLAYCNVATNNACPIYAIGLPVTQLQASNGQTHPSSYIMSRGKIFTHPLGGNILYQYYYDLCYGQTLIIPLKLVVYWRPLFRQNVLLFGL